MRELSLLHKHPIVYLFCENLEVGTPEYKVAMNWLLDMNVDVTRTKIKDCSSFKSGEDKAIGVSIKLGHFKAMALGAEAARALNEINIEEYYSLPSPRDTEAVVDADSLDLGRRFIYGELDEA